MTSSADDAGRRPSWPASSRRGATCAPGGTRYGYALVASGRVDAMVDPVAELWDLAPMPVILVGGRGPLQRARRLGRPGGGSGVASCGGPLHDELLAVLAS